MAEEWFREDAARLGYLEPGGAGLSAYYREVVGAHSPDDERRVRRREYTNFQWTRLEAGEDIL